MGPQGSAYYSVTDELRKSLSASVFEISCLLYKSLAKACACANGKMLLENNDDNDDNDNNDITATGRDNVVKSSSVQINRSNSAPSFTWISMSKFWLLKKPDSEASSSALGKAICLIPFGNMYQIPDPPGFEGYSATRILLPATISPNTV